MDTPQEALFYAIQRPSVDKAEMAIMAGADVNGHCRYAIYNRLPLHVAANHGNPEAVRLLLRYGARVDELDECGDTPLNIASRYDHPECARLLLEHRASPLILNSVDGASALHWAVGSGIWESRTLTQLLKFVSPSDIDVANPQGITPLTLAIKYKCKANGVPLIMAGARLDRVSPGTRIPMWAYKTRGYRLNQLRACRVFYGVLRFRIGVCRDMCHLLVRAARSAQVYAEPLPKKRGKRGRK